jgi:hypothetical protein
MTVYCSTTLVAVAKQAESSRIILQSFESLWIKSLGIQVARYVSV